MIMLILLIIFTIFSYLIAWPLIQMSLIKIKYGSKVKILYYPITGLFGLFTKSFKKYKDSLTFVTNVYKDDPNIKAIVSNIGNKILWVFTAPETIKEMTVDKVLNFEKRDLMFDVGHKKIPNLLWAEGASHKR